MLIEVARRPLGFDIEWRPNFRKNGIENPVALVQLADKARVLLIHVSVMGASLHSSLGNYSA